MRLVMVSLAALLAATSLLAACSSAPPPAPTQAPAPKAAEPTKAAAPGPTSAPAPAAQPTAAPAPKVNYPEKGKTITWIVPFAAGTSPDLGVRVLAAAMEKDLGTSFSIVNRVGANGQAGYTEIAKAKPDGYTIGLLVLPGIATILGDPTRQAAFTRKDLIPLAMHVQEPSIFAVKSDSPFKTVKDVVDAAKASPEKVKVATGGLLGDDNFAGLFLQKVAGVKFAIIPMSEGRQAALLGGHIDVYVGKTGDLYSQIKGGEVRVLATSGDKESKFLPGVKTMQQQGFDFTSFASRGYAAPAGTPKEIVDILSASMKRVMTSPEHLQKMDEQALTVNYLDSAQVDAFWTSKDPEIKMLMGLSSEQSFAPTPVVPQK